MASRRNSTQHSLVSSTLMRAKATLEWSSIARWTASQPVPVALEGRVRLPAPTRQRKDEKQHPPAVLPKVLGSDDSSAPCNRWAGLPALGRETHACPPSWLNTASSGGIHDANSFCSGAFAGARAGFVGIEWRIGAIFGGGFVEPASGHGGQRLRNTGLPFHRRLPNGRSPRGDRASPAHQR
jgi:hypothetical protein